LTLFNCAQQWQQQTGNHYPLQTEAYNSPQEAFARALAFADLDDLVLVTGSFYLVGTWREFEP
jgi:folylpolyglutamate synthase/dihydropteroate synthase